MSRKERKSLTEALDNLNNWFASLPYGFSEQSQENRGMVELRTKVRDEMIEKLNK